MNRLYNKKKTNQWKIPLYKIFTDTEDIRYISGVLKRGTDWAIGPEIEKFETSLAQYIGRKYCIAFNSGTSAGHAALIALGINNSFEVIIPSFTFIATANWPLMVQSNPKFVDIETQTYGMDPKDLESKISKKTKAVIPAGNKVLTTGEGGALCTNSNTLYKKLKLLRSHGREINSNYFSSIQIPSYNSLGYNWRMSSITAALGLSQIDKIEKMIDMRRKNAHYFSSKLKKFKQIRLHNEPTGYKHVYQLFSILLPNSKIREELMNFLTSKGIMSKVFFKPVHKTTFFRKNGYGTQNLPNTEKISRQILSLPMFPGLLKEEINYMVDSITEFFESTNS